NQEHKKNIVFTNQSIRALRNHDWQGNITELKTMINKIVNSTLSENHVISVDILSDFFYEKNIQIIEEQSFLRFKSLKEATHEFEKKFLIHLLKKNRYDISQVSNRLDLTTSQLRDKILKFNIEISN
ncbi:helix-turn-helix domain-containing protein, partial [Candidatus Dependentiae bacterium]